MEESKEVRQIPIEDIIPNRFQPRISFDEKALNELSSSIKQHGIIQPLVVRPLGDKFEIIAGERRYKAATMAGLTTVPAIVTEMDDGTSAEVALIENVQRKDLTAIEEAKSYKNMLDRGNLTQEELAKKMGLSQSTIANKLRLLNLCDEVQDALLNEKISERHARALLAINNKDDQVKWLNRIINERLTVRQLDLAIKDEQIEKSQINQNDNDIPIVDINPDINSIISNSTDINSAEVKKDIDSITGIDNLNDDNNEGNFEMNSTIDNNTTKNEVPNKFFNFLEDEAVNMNVEDDNKSSEVNDTNNGIDTNPSSEEIFNFTPEFNNSSDQDNLINDSVEEDKFAQFNNDIPSNEVDEIETLDVLDVPEQQQESENTQTDDLKVDSDQNTSVQSELNNEETTNINNTENNADDYITVSDAIISGDINNDNNTQEDNINIEPIPAVEGENILDPVKLFDTLESDFYDKIKESVGVDLKTAINKYRDLTTDLINRGFNINIEEIDTDNKYRIEIEIGKE